MASIKDVAKIAGVSIATVSRVFNNPNTVSEETKKRVFSAVKELGYTPNFAAKRMRKSRSKTIIAVVPDISNTFFIDLVRGVQDYAEKMNYSILMGRFDVERFDLTRYIQLVKSKAADGMVIAIGHDRHFSPIEEVKDIPLVTIEEEYMGNPYVYVDNFEAISGIVKYLVSKGRKRLGFLGFKGEKKRLEAFKVALLENELEFDEKLVGKGEGMGKAFYKSACEYVEKILSFNRIPDAVVCASDVLAAGVIKRLAKQGIKVPEDVAVTGFDNTETAELVYPGITTVEQPAQAMGHEAARLLIRKIEGKEVPTSVVFPTKIIVRESA